MKNTHYRKSTVPTKNTNSKMCLLPYICCIVILLTSTLISKAQKYSASEIARWEKHAKQVNIIRDEWGIAHVYGKTDADAVFGLMYAQSEENVGQIELNYL